MSRKRMIGNGLDRERNKINQINKDEKVGLKENFIKEPTFMLPEIDKDSQKELSLGAINVPIEIISRAIGFSVSKTRRMISLLGIGIAIPGDERNTFYCPAYLVYRICGVEYYER